MKENSISKIFPKATLFRCMLILPLVWVLLSSTYNQPSERGGCCSNSSQSVSIKNSCPCHALPSACQCQISQGQNPLSEPQDLPSQSQSVSSALVKSKLSEFGVSKPKISPWKFHLLLPPLAIHIPTTVLRV